ncbi:MAG: hypothetical protein H0W87_08455 [Actinobacteria bacterium]|nr:hypothetical protein [Actinomycetota bacterium]
MIAAQSYLAVQGAAADDYAYRTPGGVALTIALVAPLYATAILPVVYGSVLARRLPAHPSKLLCFRPLAGQLGAIVLGAGSLSAALAGEPLALVGLPAAGAAALLVYWLLKQIDARTAPSA